MQIDRRSFISMAAVSPAVGSSLAFGSSTRVTSSPRKRDRLAQWRFALGHAADPARDFGYGRDQRTFAKAGAATADATQPAFDDAAWAAVRLPHDWAVELPFAPPTHPVTKDNADAAAAHGFKAIGREFPANSVGWYRTTLPVRPADRERALWLEFDGVFRDCTVFVNGYVAATNASGYAPFVAAIGDFLDYDGGPNVLAVRVDASLGEGWFYEGAGIYRQVDLVSAARVHVPAWGTCVRTRIDADGAHLSAAVEVRNVGDVDQQVTVRQHVIGPDGTLVATFSDQAVAAAADETFTTTADTAIRAPALWSPDRPALYHLVTEIVADGTVSDRHETAFGIRDLHFDAARGFILNGRATKLLGTCNHQDHAGVGIAIPDALHRWRVAQLKDMGSNAWRSAHNPPATALLDAADAAGMMMIVETRRNSSDSEALSELERIIRRDRNHPSVIAWSLGNEEPHQGTARGARITAELQALVRRLDPTRPTTFAMDNSWDKGVGGVVDAVGFNYRTDQIAAFHAAHPAVPVYGSETGSTVATRGAYANDAAAHVVRAYDTEHPWWATTAEQWWTLAAADPAIAGGFVWTGFDYRGEPTPFPAMPSISSYFGVLDTCGFPKDNYYYYRAWWRPDQPLVHLLPHWTWPGRDGAPIEVWVHGNCSEVELRLNGRALGRKAMPRGRHLAWEVPYAPGRLEAVGYDGGRITVRDVRETAGTAAAVRLSADRRRYDTGSDDVAMIRAEIVDARGRIVPDAAHSIAFDITGDAAIIGVGNGDPTSLEADHATRRRAFHGVAQAIVRVGGRAGPFGVTAAASGLRAGRFTLWAG